MRKVQLNKSPTAMGHRAPFLVQVLAFKDFRSSKIHIPRKESKAAGRTKLKTFDKFKTNILEYVRYCVSVFVWVCLKLGAFYRSDQRDDGTAKSREAPCLKAAFDPQGPGNLHPLLAISIQPVGSLARICLVDRSEQTRAKDR